MRCCSWWQQECELKVRQRKAKAKLNQNGSIETNVQIVMGYYMQDMWFESGYVMKVYPTGQYTT